jgi:predicted chitinase
MADNTNDKKSSWIEDRFKQNLSSAVSSAAQLGSMAGNKAQEIKQDYKKFGKEASELPGQISRNRADREAILARESKSNALTESQKEQLKNISNAEDAQKFVDASILGNENGDYGAGQSIYNDSIKSAGKAWLGFGEDVAITALGGPVIGGAAKIGSKIGGAAVKGGSSLFKGAAEAIGSKLPSLKNVSNVFKSEADIATEAKAAEKARREAAREAKREEIRGNATRPKGSTFNSNAENAAKNETAAAEAKAAEKEAAKQKNVDPWTGETVNPKAPKAPKVDTNTTPKKSIIPTKTLLGAAALDAGYGIYEDPEGAWNTAKEFGNDLVHAGIHGAAALTDDPEGNEKKWKEGWDNEDIGKDVGDAASTAASVATGAYVGSQGNPFKGMAGGIVGGIGGLFAANRSSEAALSSMPSGGDTGMTGESHFGSDDMSGKSAVEILNKIYGVLSKLYDTTLTISRDTSALVRGAASQDAARDASNANLMARQNEGGSASPIFSGGGGGGEESSESSKKEDKKEGKGLWDSLTSKLPEAAKTALGAVSGAGSKVAKAAKFLAGNKGKIAAGLGAGAMLATKNLDEEFEKQGITDPYVKEAIKAKMMSESGGKGGSEGNWTKTSNARIREKMPQLAHMSDQELNDLKSQGNEVFLDKAYEKYGGFKYRGRGLTQLTGKANYAAADKALGLNGELVNNPDILSTDKELDKKVSVWFYKNAGADKKKFDNQQDANKWAINKAGGKKYAPGTALAEGELARVNKFQQSINNQTQPNETAVATTASPVKKDSEFKINPETGVYEQQKVGDIAASQVAWKEDQKNFDGMYKTTSGGGSRTKTEPEVQLTEEQKAYEKWEKDPINNPDPLAKHHSKIKPQGYLDAKDASLENKRKAINANLKANKITTEEANRQLDDINREQNNNELAKMEKANATASPSKLEDMEAEVGEVDRQKASLQEERDKLAQLSPRDEKEMTSQLDRLSDIHTEMESLNKRRNDVTGSPEYLSNLGSQNSGGTQKVSAQAPSQQTPMVTESPAGYGKAIPSVRNDDPTLKMLEEGNMWRTSTHEA